MKAKICMLCFMLFLYSCKNIFIDDKFSIKCVPYTGSELRIDGYYYKKWLWEEGNKRFIDYFIFYSNGVSATGHMEAENLCDVENRLANWSDNKWLKDNIYIWGPFSIHDDKLIMQFYEPSDYLSKRVLELSGTILNDSAFYLEKITLACTGKEITGRFFATGEYCFKQYSPKPDSTNNFIP